jgi:hypothetical protein
MLRRRAGVRAMVATRKTIKVTSESTVDELLADANEGPVVLERDGVRYQLSRETTKSDIWAGWEPDPEGMRQMLHEVAGSWSDLDIDAIIEELYEERELGSRPPDRP